MLWNLPLGKGSAFTEKCHSNFKFHSYRKPYLATFEDIMYSYSIDFSEGCSLGLNSKYHQKRIQHALASNILNVLQDFNVFVLHSFKRSK